MKTNHLSLLAVAAIVLVGMCMPSCGPTDQTNNSHVFEKEGRIMVGTRSFKMVDVVLNGNYIRTMVPADSTVSVIPTAVNTGGKANETTVLIK